MTAKAMQKKDQLPATIDFSDDIGKGFEGADRESFAIPFLAVLQKISPQCDEGDAEYIPGAKAGMIVNTVTKELFDGDEGVTFVPAAYTRRFVRWAPRGASGGFKGELLPEDVKQKLADGEFVQADDSPLIWVPDESGKVNEKKSDRVADTRNHFCILTTGQQVMLSLASTQIKKSRTLMSALDMVRFNGKKPPMWANVVRATVRQESNDQGTWYGWHFALEGFVQDADIYAAARDFHETVMAGDVEYDLSKQPGAMSEDDDGKF